MCSLSQLEIANEHQPLSYENECLGSVSTVATLSDKSEFNNTERSASHFSGSRWSQWCNKLFALKSNAPRVRGGTFGYDKNSYSDNTFSVSSRSSAKDSLKSTDSLDTPVYSETKGLKSRSRLFSKGEALQGKCSATSCFFSNGATVVRHSRSSDHNGVHVTNHNYTTKASIIDERDSCPPKPHSLTKELPIHSSRRRLSLSQSEPVDPHEVEAERGTCHVSKNLRPPSGKNRSTSKIPASRKSAMSKCTFNGQRMSITGLPSSIPQQDFENKAHEVFSSETQLDQDALASMGIGYTCRKGLKPESPNQDDFFIFVMDDWALYGVFDGHGAYGHDVSNFVQKRLPRLIYENAYFETNPKQALRFSFIMVQKLLEIESSCRTTFNCVLSGCTATVVLHRKLENKLYVAHVGDSRCVLGRYTNGGITAVDLTIDHKPDNELEMRRVLEAGGQIRKLEGDICCRVFLKDKQFPGLAISRALGDTAGVQAGVTCEPDVREYTLNAQRDAFIVLCSDGVWEFLTSKFVVELVYCNGAQAAQLSADMLARESWERWIDKGSVVDDITAEIIYLN